jgi:hypothetical protein
LNLKGFLRKLFRRTVAVIITVNLVTFGYFAWPKGYTALDLQNAGIQTVITAAKDAIIPGEIYELDSDRSIVQAILRLDAQLYSQSTGRLVPVGHWKAYVITGELARYISHKTGAFAFTYWGAKVIYFLDVPSANNLLVIAHEFVHVLQAEDDKRIANLPKIVAEYEAEFISRGTVGLLSGITLAGYPVHDISTLEKIQALKHLAELGV